MMALLIALGAANDTLEVIRRGTGVLGCVCGDYD